VGSWENITIKIGLKKENKNKDETEEKRYLK
jgi:hypothetical protein